MKPIYAFDYYAPGGIKKLENYSIRIRKFAGFEYAVDFMGREYSDFYETEKEALLEVNEEMADKIRYNSQRLKEIVR